MKKLIFAIVAIVGIGLFSPLTATSSPRDSKAQCRGFCQEDLDLCSDMCKEHVPQATSQCIDFCRQAYNECIREC